MAKEGFLLSLNYNLEMKINPIQIKTSNSEIGWMLGSPQNIFDKVYRYFLFVCWTVISPLVILAILIYYIIDVTVSTFFMFPMKDINPNLMHTN